MTRYAVQRKLSRDVSRPSSLAAFRAKVRHPLPYHYLYHPVDFSDGIILWRQMPYQSKREPLT